jgi:hypothetical protein
MTVIVIVIVIESPTAPRFSSVDILVTSSGYVDDARPSPPGPAPLIAP